MIGYGMENKRGVISGGTSGIGLAAARMLAAALEKQGVEIDESLPLLPEAGPGWSHRLAGGPGSGTGEEGPGKS